MALGFVFACYLPALVATNLTLIVAFGYWVFKAGYAQRELLYYFLLFLTLLARCHLLRERRPGRSMGLALIAGVLAALTHLTKAAMPLFLGVFFVAYAFGELVRWRQARPADAAGRREALTRGAWRAAAAGVLLASFLAVLFPYISTSKRVFPGPLALSRVADGRFIDVNQAFAEIVGLRREDLLGRTALEVGLWPSAQDRQRTFSPFVEHGSASRLPARVRHDYGELRDARISGITLELEGEACLLVLAEDVTDLNRAQTALGESEARLRAATEGSLDAFMLLDAVRDERGQVVDFRLAEINQVAERMIGRRRDEVLGGSLLGRCPVHRPPAPLFERYRAAFDSAQPWEDEFEIREKGLRRRWLRQQGCRSSTASRSGRGT